MKKHCNIIKWIGILLLMPVVCTATNYYVDNSVAVDGDGSISHPWKNIQVSINNLKAGDTLNIRGDAFGEGRLYSITSPLDFSNCQSGSSTANITVQAYPGERVMVRNDGNGFLMNMKLWDGRYWIFKDILFDQNSVADDCIRIGSAENGRKPANITFSSCTIRNGQADGMDIVLADSVVVEDCKIYNFFRYGADCHGIVLMNGKDNIFRNNEIYDCTGDCIQIITGNAEQTLIEKNHLYTTLDDKSENAIDIKSNMGTILRGNKCHGFRNTLESAGTAVVINGYMPSILVERNIVYDSEGGIRVNSTDDGVPTNVLIRNNLVYNIINEQTGIDWLHYGEGIYVNGASDVTIYNNTVYNTNGYSIVCGINKFVNNLVVKNNIFDNGYAATFTANVTNSDISYNGFFNLQQGIPSQATLSVTGTSAGFVDPNNPFLPNFHLADNSPCIDAGTDTEQPYAGTAPDLGAYESGTVATTSIVFDTPTEGSPDMDISLNGNFSVNWEHPANAWITGYEIQEMVLSGEWITIARNILPHVKSYDVRGKLVGNTYFYRVRAMDENGQWGTFSASSDGIRVVSKAVEFPPAGTVSYNDIIWINLPDGCFSGTVTFIINDVLPSTTGLEKAIPAIGYILTTAKKLVAIRDDNQTVSSNGSLTLTIAYPDAGTETEQGYLIYEWSDNAWKAIESQIDTVNNRITATITTISSYIIAATALSNVSTFTATTGNNCEVFLSWILPSDSRVKDVVVLRKTNGYPTDHTDGVEIYRGAGTSTTDLEILSGETYYYAAFTSDKEGRHSLATSSAQKAITPTDTTPPGSVGSFTATGKYGKIILNWTNPMDRDYQKTVIVRKIDSYPATVTDGVEVYIGKGISHKDAIVIEGVLYCYTAFSYDGVNYSSGTQCFARPTTDITPPSTPGTLTENSFDREADIDVSIGSYLLRWDNAQAYDEDSGIAYYEIEERINNGSWTLVKQIPENNVTASFGNKQPGNVYYYRFRGINGVGVPGSYSVSSDGIRVVNKAVILPATSSIAYMGTDKKFITADIPTSVYAGGTIFGITQVAASQTNLLQAEPPIERLLGNAWQLVAVDEGNNLIQPAGNIMLIVSYPDPDGSNEKEDMERYRLFALDEGVNVWRVVPGSQIIMGTTNVIQVAVGSLSTYVVAKLRDIIPPMSVGSFTVIGREHEVELSWENPEDIDYVRTEIVRRADRFPGSITDGSVIYIGTGTGYVDATVTDSTTYYYAAFSYDGTSYSTATTGSAAVIDRTPPAGIGSFTATGKMGKIELEWSNPVDADFSQTKIIRSTIDFPATCTGYFPIYVGTKTTYVDINVTNGVTYYYTGFAYDKVGNISSIGSSSQAAATPGIDTPPSAPGTVTEGYFDVDAIIYPGTWTVCWGQATDEETGISKYELQQRINDGTWTTIVDTAGNATGYSGFRGSIGDVYYYRVRAMNWNGIWGSYTVSDGIRVVNDASDVRYGAIKWVTTNTSGKSGVGMDVSGRVESGIITISQKLVGDVPFSILGKAYQIMMINSENKEIQPQGSVSLTLFYPDPDTNDEETDKQYRIYLLDQDGWHIVPGEQRVSPENDQITVELSHFSIYAVGVQVQGIMVYPNPFNPGRYVDHVKIIFKGWNGHASIRIYKLNGELIEEMDGNDMKEWMPSSDIASGVYIYVIEVQGGQRLSGKLAIIR
ncbi:MAG: right-handed parallel beta-helix repeat-containing protein [bacterium]|nr:right-handed parallel beta-helix repeat-containing protein [bacterium]